jgi:hypothetical protein
MFGLSYLLGKYNFLNYSKIFLDSVRIQLGGNPDKYHLAYNQHPIPLGIIIFAVQPLQRFDSERDHAMRPIFNCGIRTKTRYNS